MADNFSRKDQARYSAIVKELSLLSRNGWADARRVDYEPLETELAVLIAKRNAAHTHAPEPVYERLYELRIDGQEPERSTNVVDLYWKARAAVCNTAKVAVVESVNGTHPRNHGVHAIFSNNTLAKWERDGVATHA